MRPKKTSLIFFLFVCGILCAQHKHHHALKVDSANYRHPQGIYFAFGPSFSAIDVYSNYLQNPHMFGIDGRIYAEFSNTLRIAGEFTRIPKFKSASIWTGLSAWNADLNLHFMARIKDNHSIFYAFTGLCHHQWKGFYEGGPYIYDAIVNYPPKNYASGGWLGMNFGVGLERAFKYFELFGEYRYRFSKNEIAFGISDVAMNFGIKKKIPVNRIFKKLKDKYSWF